jgi:hypothetical protein
MTSGTAEPGSTGVFRRSVLKGAASIAGVTCGSGAISGYLGADHQGRRAAPRRPAGHRHPGHRRTGHQGPRLPVPGLAAGLFTSALGAQLTWTLPFGLFAMFAVVNRFNGAWEEAATDLGASAWQRLRYVTIPLLLPGIIGVAMGAFILSCEEYARTTLTIGPKTPCRWKSMR